MTGYKSSDFRHKCPPCLIEQLPSWDDLLAGLKRVRGIMPTDIDGMVEINHHFLFIEGKNKGANLSGGQRTALLRLSELPKVTVLILRVTEDEDKLELMRFRAGTVIGTAWARVTRREVTLLLEAWAYAADGS